MEDELIEILADYEHDSWSRWQKHVFDNSIENNDGSFTIPKELVDRWQRQINTSYCDLSEQEKESDRKEVRRVLEYVEKMVRNV